LRALALSALLALTTGCPGQQIEMVERKPDDNDHGHAALLAAVEAHTAVPPSPVAFREFVLQIAQLRPRFNEEVSDFAELYLAFSALPVMESLVDLPRDQQLHALALTVFPTAFGLEPIAGEKPRDYLLRLCGEQQPLECKEYVPEAWPVVLSAKVRRKLKFRAQEALSGCNICGNEETYTGILERFSDKVAAEDAFAALNEGDYFPSAWSIAGGAAATWSGAPVFAIDGDGDAVFEGEELPVGSWQQPLKQGRQGRAVLGVHLRPDDRVRTLKTIATDASRAGYSELALQVRAHGFPYVLSEYRIGLRGRGKRIDVRDVDTIQILARVLDALHQGGHTSPRL